jgi:hypothetical protein
MYVRWQHVFNKNTTAILVESTRVNGKPRQRHIAYLGSIDYWALNGKNDVQYRAQWWHNISSKLDALGNRVLPENRRKIEAALAKEVPPVPGVPARPPTPAPIRFNHTVEAVVNVATRRRR